MDRVVAHFQSIADQTFINQNTKKDLYGFGCVALVDKAYPNFPSLLVLHRLHYIMHGSKILPKEFVNQDGDPYVYNIYTRWNASRMARDCVAVNKIGGHECACYEKVG